VFYHSTVTRLWRGVASTLLGRAFDGGTRTALIGVLMRWRRLRLVRRLSVHSDALVWIADCRLRTES
jgi:hypothetical protein